MTANKKSAAITARRKETSMKILIAEDELSLAKAITAILKKNNYEAEAVHDGENALHYLSSEQYDAAILDVMMPQMDGVTVLKQYREGGGVTPILMLTAKSEVDDIVLGLDSGANDYLTKPFAPKELLARLRAMTRQQTVQPSSKLRLGNVSLDRASYELSSPAGSFHLTNKEFQMMELLLINAHQLIPTERFMEKIWGYDSTAEINVVWVYISYLRKKLTSLEANIHIRVTRNAGYTLEEIV